MVLWAHSAFLVYVESIPLSISLIYATVPIQWYILTIGHKKKCISHCIIFFFFNAVAYCIGQRIPKRHFFGVPQVNKGLWLHLAHAAGTLQMHMPNMFTLMRCEYSLICIPH